MSTAPDSMNQPLSVTTPVIVPPGEAAPDRWLSELHSLLRELETVTEAQRTLPPVFSEAVDEQLVRMRLGIAASLFAALRCKNAAVAGHSLRVALTSSGWANWLELPARERDAIEVAALLHDIGVIGAPDRILFKAGALSEDESNVMARSRQMSLEILRHSCGSPQILEIMESISAWYDGSRAGFPHVGLEIPRGARMIAIVEAFDSMTTDHVYRPARSQERAITELYECAGSQFDPELVQKFVEFHESDQTAVHWEVAHRWLRSLEPGIADSHWELSVEPVPRAHATTDVLFQGRLLDNMYDAVVFIDAGGRVMLWNRGAERLTGIIGASICQQAWNPELLGMSDEKGRIISEADCPVHTAIRCGAQSLRRLTILGRSQLPISVDTHAIPVIDLQGVTLGAILLFHDASSETSLEQRCQNLHDKATKDPLTQVANRAEFDRVHAMFVAAHRQQNVPCSLLMCDLDRFKKVNDTYGHQAGDDAIKCIASLLKSSCRAGDLVARYGGEEFVMLCADCDNATAARRAEQIRKAFSEVPQPRMEGRTVTVSFGVTEIQPGDTPETMLRRADRALLMAKAGGRNRVIQLGTGAVEDQAELALRMAQPKELLQQDLVTPVPVKIAIEKLRGFVADHQARILSIDRNQVRLEIETIPTSRQRRADDRPLAFAVELSFEEQRLHAGIQGPGNTPRPGTTRTKIHIAINPSHGRDRRRENVTAQAKELLASFRSYLMASEEESSLPIGALTRAKRILAPWLAKPKK